MISEINNSIKVERFFIENLKLENMYPPLFLVGPPRSGTTLIFLHVLNNFNFGFFPNISKAHPEACISYALDVGKHEFEPTYDNTYGDIEGNFQPSDGWDIFNRYFPKYDLSQLIKVDKLYELKNIYYFFEKLYAAPILNKNIGNSIRIEHLHKLFPNAIFIWIQRELTDNVLSLMEVRKDLKAPLDLWWCTPPPQFYNKKYDNELEMTASQILGLNAAIKESLSQINANQWLKIDYEDFCDHPDHVINWIESIYKDLQVPVRRREGNFPNSFKASKKRFTGRQELEQQIRKIQEAINL